MTKQQKQIAVVAAGALALLLLYRWYQNRSSSAATGVTAPDTSASDYASLAGQEQSDVAALQGQEQSDATTLAGQVSDLTAQLAGIPQLNLKPLEDEVAKLASGQKAVNRVTTARVNTHRGSPFYKYYVKVTGHAPPAHIQASDFVYRAWKAGINATALAHRNTHPSARNRHVAHPNPDHKPRAGAHRKLPKPKPHHKASRPRTSGVRK